MTVPRSRAAELVDAPLFRYRVTYWVKDRPGATKSVNIVARTADAAREVAKLTVPDFRSTVVSPRRLGPVRFVSATGGAS